MTDWLVAMGAARRRGRGRAVAWEEQMAVRLPDILAGFFGGLTYAIVFTRASPWEGVAAVIVGTIAAQFLGPDVAAWTHLSGQAAAYLTGIAAHAGVIALIKGVRKWTGFPPSPK